MILIQYCLLAYLFLHFRGFFLTYSFISLVIAICQIKKVCDYSWMFIFLLRDVV